LKTSVGRMGEWGSSASPCYTVTVLIAYLETDNCATAARSLATEDRLDLENYAVNYFTRSSGGWSSGYLK